MFIFSSILEVDTIIGSSLYAIRWENEKHNSLDQMAIQYNDVQYLHLYFTNNEKKLKYYKQINLTDATIRTQKEANALIQELKDLALGGLDNEEKSLNDLFERLHTEEAYDHLRYYTDVSCKAKTSRTNSTFGFLPTQKPTLKNQ